MGEVFGLVAGAVDGDGFLFGVDEPDKFDTIGQPLLHLLLPLARLVERADDLEDKVGAPPRKAPSFLLLESIHLVLVQPGDVSAEHRAVWKGKSDVGEDLSTTVCVRPSAEIDEYVQTGCADQTTRNCLDVNVAVCLALDPEDVVALAEDEQFIIRYRRGRPEADWERHFCDREIHGHSLRPYPAGSHCQTLDITSSKRRWGGRGVRVHFPRGAAIGLI